MQPKPHILKHWKAGKARIRKIGRQASLWFNSPYNSSNLRKIVQFKRFQFLD